ncbi:unnamed protein product [Lactuca saligna]|uniref:Uncharacterized protein n=1 Tax=Lactuca saligna TaxID=75948 RepID=A0AA35YNI8_LACSI|nr:unnamed protein product [Lactuca saligna]
MFEDDNTIVDAMLILKSFNMLQKPSSLIPFYDFSLSSSSEESKEEAHDEANKHTSPKTTLESDQGNGAQANSIDDSKPSKHHDDVNNDDDKKSKSSTSGTGSSGENIASPFALLEL